MAKEVFMPKAGMDMQEGTIISWLFDVGDEVKEGEPILEIETDKVTMEVESPCDGVLLRKYFEAGTVVPVVTIIGYVGEPGESVPEKPSKAGGTVRAEDEQLFPKEYRSSSEAEYDCRIAVIGGGAAGIAAALRAAHCGKKTILFEKDGIGGVNGCSGSVPMKIYLHTAANLDEIRRAGGQGIRLEGNVVFDLEELRAHKDHVVGHLQAEAEKRLRDAGVTIIREEAQLIGPHHIQAAQKTYRFENAVLCCGSSNAELSIPGAGETEILTPEKMFELKEVPKRLLIIGGGVIGCEMADAWNRFGADVTLIERQDRILPTFDQEIADALTGSMRSRGIRVITGGAIERIEEKDAIKRICLRDGIVAEGEILLAAVGRKPNLQALGVMAEKLDFERGKLVVDEYCRTGLEGIYACGDMTNRSILAHSAIKMGDAAASTASGKARAVHLNRAPLNLYTLPEAAGIGMTEREARRNGEILVGRCALAENERAVTGGRTEGFVKVIADKGYGEILGVHIFGGPATEMIVEAKALMDMEITVYEASEIMHAHPSWSEAFMEACADAVGESLFGF